MKNWLLAITLSVFSYVSSAQVRIAAQSGIGFISEKGYDGYVNNTFSLGWKFENKISWGLQFSTAISTKFTDNTDYFYCDSSKFLGWKPWCVGFDSLVNTDVRKKYSINTFSVYFLNEIHVIKNLTVEIGALANLSFLKYEQAFLDSFLKNQKDKTEKALGGGVNLMLRTSYTPNKEKSFNLFVEFFGGIFISPQDGCTDGGCDNFLESSYNLQSGIQLGVAF